MRSSIAIIVFVALWEALPRLGWVDRTFLPPFSVVLRALYDAFNARDLDRLLAALAEDVDWPAAW